MFGVIVVILHVLRPDLPPLKRGISRYAGEPTLGLMTVGFFALVIALLSQSIRDARGAVWLAVALGLTAVALSPVGRASTSRTVAAVHVAGGLVFYLAAAVALVVTAPDVTSLWISRAFVAMLSLFLLGAAGVPGLRSLSGLFQRLVFGVFVVWMVRSGLS